MGSRPFVVAAGAAKLTSARSRWMPSQRFSRSKINHQTNCCRARLGQLFSAGLARLSCTKLGATLYGFWHGHEMAVGDRTLMDIHHRGSWIAFASDKRCEMHALTTAIASIPAHVKEQLLALFASRSLVVCLVVVNSCGSEAPGALSNTSCLSASDVSVSQTASNTWCRQ